MLSRSVKITSKGQVTIPKKIREILGADNVYFEIEEDNIIIRSVRDVGGLLSEYAKNVKQIRLCRLFP
ncbi:MAG: AbrB/MazE/SpoVT family DNA-binding domain-containing protein, partial [Deltaproteobacteria bacterium]